MKHFRDVIGMVGADYLSIGDTLSEDADIVYDEIPSFPPDVLLFFIIVTLQLQAISEGLDQLVQEVGTHCFEVTNNADELRFLQQWGLCSLIWFSFV